MVLVIHDFPEFQEVVGAVHGQSVDIIISVYHSQVQSESLALALSYPGSYIQIKANTISVRGASLEAESSYP